MLIDKTTSILGKEGVSPLDRGKLISINDRMASEGIRVLCIGMRRWGTPPDILSADTVENGLTILGLAGMVDPPREGAKEAVALCKEAGIQVVTELYTHSLTDSSGPAPTYLDMMRYDVKTIVNALVGGAQ